MAKVPAEGSPQSKILILGDHPSAEEVRLGKPFLGGAGMELTKMLREAGLDRANCYLTNVLKENPPYGKLDNWIDLRKTQPPGFVWSPFVGGWVHPTLAEAINTTREEISRLSPNIIVALGNLPLQTLCGLSGIGKWRGSIVASSVSRPDDSGGFKVLPTFHPSSILRSWSDRFVVVHDLKRVARECLSPGITPRDENFLVRPSFTTVRETLQSLLCRVNSGERVEIGTDIETRIGQIACFGIAWSKREALCIPILTQGQPEGYWSLEEEKEIILLLRTLLTHPNAYVIWQNGLYDLQYIARLWGFLPNFSADTMLYQHTMFPTLEKSLAFIASLHCDNYVYWKDDGKNYDPGKDSEDTHWVYNSRDAVITVECAESLDYGLRELNHKRTKYGTPVEIQHRMAKHVLRAMLRGVRWDFEHARKLLWDLGEARLKREEYLNKAVGRVLNTNSPKQLQELFYGEFGFKPIINRKTRSPTTDADALEELSLRDPAIRPLCTLINEIRQIRTALGFVGKKIDADGRIRCSYNVAGTDTFRFSSSEDAFGFGTNLQNVTSGDEGNPVLPMPNLRKLFIPDPGKTWIDFDLPQADARIVAWDADDRELMAIFLDPKADLHMENAKAIFGHCPDKNHPNRQLAKKGVHAVNYLVTAPELARHLGVTVHEADRFIKLWFAAHPKISEWHNRIRYEVQTRRYIENIYGFRRYVFERIDERLIKALVAWIPQSTTAITVNLGIDATCSDVFLQSAGVDFLLQVHDSADFQYPTHRPELREKIKERMTIEVPYETPLIMPPGWKESTISWGHCG